MMLDGQRTGELKACTQDIKKAAPVRERPEV
jgi:hypothetical protein